VVCDVLATLVSNGHLPKAPAGRGSAGA
jgi:hypothetical protein